MAAPGLTGLETALALVLRLVHAGRISFAEALARLTCGPARALRLAERTGLTGLGTLAAGAPADVVVIDPDRIWTVQPAALASKGKNTPFDGWQLTGQVLVTVASGTVTYNALEN